MVTKNAILMLAPSLPLDVAMMARALEDTAQLQSLVTQWCFTEKEIKLFTSLGVSKNLLTRRLAPVHGRYLSRHVLVDLSLRLHACYKQRRTVDHAFSLLDRYGSRQITRDTVAVLAREDSCIQTFQAAKDRDVQRIYQLPTGYASFVRKLLLSESQLFPDIFPTTFLDSEFAPERMRRKQQEAELSDYILCPSRFVGNSLVSEGIAPKKITLLPLGADSRWVSSAIRPRTPTFLYVGNVSGRKGVHRILKAWKKLRGYRTHELRLIGDMKLPASFLSEFKGTFTHLPRVPRDQLREHYSTAQAFIFNPLADGFGHVFAEAMICGTPVICSKNSGGPDFITDGLDGRLLDYGNDDQLLGVLDWALTHPIRLLEMGQHARKRAANWGWNEFSAAFLGVIAARLTGQSS